MDAVIHVLAHLPHLILHWLHVVFGIAWIGLLFYFNFVQGRYLANATEAGTVDVFTKLVPVAQKWRRWAAMVTFITGAVLFSSLTALSLGIFFGSVMGTVMMLNVWLIIWPNQKRIIASHEAIRDGGEADPRQPAATAKAFLASRTNMLLSLPMLYFMVCHDNSDGVHSFGALVSVNAWIGLAIVAAIEANAIWGRTGLLATERGVIASSVVLTVVMAFVLGFEAHIH